jgi:hypothetical protein
MPAGFPLGMPGMGDVIEMAIQQAPHFSLHSIICYFYAKLSIDLFISNSLFEYDKHS